MLDRLYLKFDALSIKHGIFKVVVRVSRAMLFAQIAVTVLPANVNSATLQQKLFTAHFTIARLLTHPRTPTRARARSRTHTHKFISKTQVETIGDSWMGVTNLVEDQVIQRGYCFAFRMSKSHILTEM